MSRYFTYNLAMHESVPAHQQVLLPQLSQELGLDSHDLQPLLAKPGTNVTSSSYHPQGWPRTLQATFLALDVQALLESFTAHHRAQSLWWLHK